MAGPDDAGPHQRRHRLGRARPLRARPLRGRLRRGQRAPGEDGADRRAGPDLGPAPGRCPRRNGHPQPYRPRRRHPPRPAVQRPGRLRDPQGHDLRARERHGPPPNGPRPHGWTRPTSSGPSFSLGNRIDVSVRSRFFTGGTRRAIELRDRICTHPHCYEPAENCQVDHIQTYASGGLTTQDNGRLLCGFHNRLRNQREGKGEPAPAAPTVGRLRGGPASPLAQSAPAAPRLLSPPAVREAEPLRAFGAPGFRRAPATRSASTTSAYAASRARRRRGTDRSSRCRRRSARQSAEGPGSGSHRSRRCRDESAVRLPPTSTRSSSPCRGTPSACPTAPSG